MTDTKFIASSFRLEGGTWEPVNEECWLAPDERTQRGFLPELLAELALDDGGAVDIRYEVWVDDSTWELKGEAVHWVVTYPLVSEDACFDTAEEALRDITATQGGCGHALVRRLVRVHTYGGYSVVVAPEGNENTEQV